MLFIIGTLLAFTYLEMPWRFIALVPLALVESIDVIVWLRWRKRRSIAGAEGLVGAVGRAITDLDPGGQVRVKGQIWRADAPGPIEAGAHIVVEEVDGLKLRVTRRKAAPGAQGDGHPSPGGPGGIVQAQGR